jgi:dihydroorotate dehydrogenase electron transfer subunit
VKLRDPTHGYSHTKARQLTAQVVENETISCQTYRRIVLSVPPGGGFEVLPGQFFMIRTNPGFHPLLRRPFSILSLRHLKKMGQIHMSILFRTVGEGTRLMAEWTYGHSVDMIGPLGRGYSLPKDTETVVIIAGGLGIASLFGLVESIFRRSQRPEVLVYIGAKSAKDILMRAELEDLGAQVEVTTEDGTAGRKGMVTHWVESEVSDFAEKGNTVVYACGPLTMLAAIAKTTHRVSLPCQVSLETRMACGMGSCLGCAVRTRDRGYQMVCKEGPVFDAREIDWEREERLL